MNTINKKAFTLIELLVVILIIGILAAIALPQYQKAIEKTHTAQLKVAIKSIAGAEETYHLSNGEYTTDFDKLDINFPGGQIKSGRGVCNIGSVNFMQFDNFEIVIGTGTGTSPLGVYGFRTTGKYKCAGFGYVLVSLDTLPLKQITCSEPAGSVVAAKGVYCSLMGYPNLVYTSQWNDKTYYE